jgi:integrase
MATCKVLLRKRSRTNGESTVHLRVTINRTHSYFTAGFSWLPEYFDGDTGKTLPRFKNDKLSKDYNLILGQMLAKANEIFVYFRLSGQVLTKEKFKMEFESTSSRNSFLDFMEKRILERWNRGLITDSTKKHHMNTFLKFKTFSPKMNFADLGPRTAEIFDDFLKKNNVKSRNGRWGHHRNFKTYLNEAAREGFKFYHPYNYFKLTLTESTWKALSENQLMNLMDYHERLPEGSEKYILRRFLFSCFTGLRISDQLRVELDWLDEDFLVYLPHKVRKKNKLVQVPVTKIALKYWNEALPFAEEGFLWPKFTSQYALRVLKTIAEQLDIPRLHHHMARETFATLFIENGGSIDALKSYLGHSSWKVTEKYVHTSKKRLREQSQFINQLQISVSAN